MNTLHVDPATLTTRPPFSTLFPINSLVLCAIQETIQASGFDESKPLDVWLSFNSAAADADAFCKYCSLTHSDWSVSSEHPATDRVLICDNCDHTSRRDDVWQLVLVDGHTRRTAALNLELNTVPVYVHEFADEQEALEYAIHNQRNRRNLTDADILRCVAVLDERKSERGGGDRRSADIQSKAQDCANEKSAHRTAEVVGVSPRKVEQVRTVLDHADPEVKQAVESGSKSINAAYNETQERRRQQIEEPPASPALVKFFDATPTPAAPDLAMAIVEPEVTRPKTVSKFNRTNDNVEWALWTWNPVTGCLHNCPYCYARDIANRFYNHLPEGERFKPVFYEDRIHAPRYMKVPEAAKDNIGEKNVFVCSMADLWGKWVPTEWIERVLAEVEAAPEWNFLFLTKFPARYEEFAGRIPANAWIGTTVDRQHAVQRAEKAFAKVQAAGHEGVRWLSCEPMLERLTFERLDMFDWVVVGGSSRSTQTPEFKPPIEWAFHLWEQAKAANCRYYMKTNLGVDNEIRIREYPSPFEVEGAK